MLRPLSLLFGYGGRNSVLEYFMFIRNAARAILVIGSLWIMHNLDYHMLDYTTAQKNQYVHDNEGL